MQNLLPRDGTRISLYSSIVRIAFASFLPVMLAGCSMGLALSVPKDTSNLLKPGSKRGDVIAVLGQPRKSATLSPPRPPPSVPDTWPSAKVSLCDEYKVSGLLLTPDEAGAYDNQWGIYPICLILTAGTCEAISLPATAGDLTLRSLRRYRLRLWYDRSQKLVSYDKQ